MKIIDSTDFQKVQPQYSEILKDTFGKYIGSFRLVNSTNNSELFELTTTEGKKVQRLVIGTYDKLPLSINLPDYDKYFQTTMIMDPSKSVQIIQFNEENEAVENKCYGFNFDRFKE